MLSFHFLCWKPLLSLSKIKLGLNECFSLYIESFLRISVHSGIYMHLFPLTSSFPTLALCPLPTVGIVSLACCSLYKLGNILHAAFNYYRLLTENPFPEFVPVPAAQLFKMNLSCTELTSGCLFDHPPSHLWSGPQIRLASSLLVEAAVSGCWGVLFSSGEMFPLLF